MSSQLKKTSALSSLLHSGLLWSAETATPSLKNPMENPPASDVLPTARSPKQQAYATSLKATFGVDSIDAALPVCGLPFGHLHEFSFTHTHSSSATKVLTPFFIVSWLLAHTSRQEAVALRCAAQKRHLTIWIDPRCWPTPHTLEQTFNGTCWREFSFFLDPIDTKMRFWSILEAARYSSVFAIVANASHFSATAYRKLLLAIQRGGGLGLLVRSPQELQQPSPAYSRWMIAPYAHTSHCPAWELSLQKIKGSLRTGISSPHTWQLFWDEEQELLQECAVLSPQHSSQPSTQQAISLDLETDESLRHGHAIPRAYTAA